MLIMSNPAHLVSPVPVPVPFSWSTTSAAPLGTATSAIPLLAALARLVHNDRSIPKHTTIQLVDCPAGLFVISHLYKAEAFTAPCFSITNHCAFNNLPKLPN